MRKRHSVLREAFASRFAEAALRAILHEREIRLMTKETNTTHRRRKLIVAALAIVAVAITAGGTHRLWLPAVQDSVAAFNESVLDDHDDHADHEPGDAGHEDHNHADEGHDHEDEGHDELADDEHEGHDHAEDGGQEHDGHDEATSLTLSDEARKNIRLELYTVQLRDFQRTVTVPAVVVGRPARSEITVSAPMTGIITRIYPIRGEAIAPGAPLFDLRLTHEDLVEKQTALLRDLEQLDVVEQEIARLEGVTRSGVVAGKTQLEKVYEQQMIKGSIRAEREALRLHGLSEAQVASIESDRRLVREILISAPSADVSEHSEQHEDYLQVGSLSVKRGDHVMTGTPLAILTDHCELYIEGQAFEYDAAALNEALSRGTPVSALIEANDGSKQELGNLRLLYVENQVERDTRALKFYVSLTNELARNESTPDGHRFIAWRYRPGQRVEILVPVERWTDRIVLPIESVIQEGAEWFVFQAYGNHFDRKPVHVEYRDQRWAVIENDDTLIPGDQIVARGAYAIHLAIKNKSGGAVDPHAGHGH